MNTTKSFFLVIFIAWLGLLLGCSPKEQKDRIWTFEIKGIELDSFRGSFRGSFNQIIYFEKDKSNNHWVINVPDSVYYDYDLLNLDAYYKERWSDIFILDTITKTGTNGSLYFPDNKSVFLDASYFNPSGDDMDIIPLVVGYSDPKSVTEFIVERKISALLSNIEEKKDTLYQYVKRYPDSQALMRTVFLDYKETADLKTLNDIYSLFSERVKRTPHGTKLKQYIEDKERFEASNKFLVFDLLRSDNLKEEPFLQNDGRYKLVIFSASWCGPCHQIIPIYKEIYNDLSSDLDMIYISIDDKDYIDDWRKKILEQYQIPWQSYFSYNVGGRFLQKYNENSIPCSFLVYPNMTFEKIDVRREEDRTKLYELVNQ